MTTSTDTRMAWEAVAEHLDGLGLKLKLHFEEGTGASPAKEITEALKHLGNAIEATFTAIGAAAGDAAVRDDAATVARSLGNALADTLSEAGQELSAAADGLRCHGAGHHDKGQEGDGKA